MYIYIYICIYTHVYTCIHIIYIHDILTLINNFERNGKDVDKEFNTALTLDVFNSLST